MPYLDTLKEDNKWNYCRFSSLQGWASLVWRYLVSVHPYPSRVPCYFSSLSLSPNSRIPHLLSPTFSRRQNQPGTNWKQLDCVCYNLTKLRRLIILHLPCLKIWMSPVPSVYPVLHTVVTELFPFESCFPWKSKKPKKEKKTRNLHQNLTKNSWSIVSFPDKYFNQLSGARSTQKLVVKHNRWLKYRQ